MYVFVSCARGAVAYFGDRSILCPCCHLIGAGTAHEQALLVDPPETWKVDQTDGSDHAEVDLPVAGAILGNESVVLQVREAGGFLAQKCQGKCLWHHRHDAATVVSPRIDPRPVLLRNNYVDRSNRNGPCQLEPAFH